MIFEAVNLFALLPDLMEVAAAAAARTLPDDFFGNTFSDLICSDCTETLLSTFFAIWFFFSIEVGLVVDLTTFLVVFGLCGLCLAWGGVDGVGGGSG